MWYDRPPDNRQLVAEILVATLVLNVIDASLTLRGYQKGFLLEVNPFLALLIEAPWLFLTVKLFLVCGGGAILWRFRDHKWVLPGAVFVFICYFAVVMYHLQGLASICG